jgi:hypothetical protein
MTTQGGRRLRVSKPRKPLTGRPVTDDRGNSTWQWGGESGTEVQADKVRELAEGLSLEPLSSSGRLSVACHRVTGDHLAMGWREWDRGSLFTDTKRMSGCSAAMSIACASNPVPAASGDARAP